MLVLAGGECSESFSSGLCQRGCARRGWFAVQVLAPAPASKLGSERWGCRKEPSPPQEKGSGCSVRLQALSCPFPPAQLHYLRLPKDISEDHVILMDCTVSTGAAAMMAVRVLLVWRTLGALHGEGGLFPSNVNNTSHGRAEGLWDETGSSMERMV